jgi:hypothetical protein
VEIVTGVAPGERVIARGHESLYAGARIAEVGPTEATSVGAQGPPGSAPATPRAAPHTGH